MTEVEKAEKQAYQLPDNAFRELKPGEEYEPIMRPDKVYPEVTPWSVSWGFVMVVLFSAAAAYLGLKVGQVFEAAIPIAIIAIGLQQATHRKNAMGENVIIQSIGACSGAVVAGAIFVLPAIYMLDLQASFFKIFLASALGGVLGILFLIPFRKYFVKDMHGKYPFPEATATTQVLVSGTQGGSQAKPLLLSGLIGGLYDFIVSTFGLWNENFTSRVTGLGQYVADHAKLVFKVNTGAAVFGLGYIVGFRYALIITLGSLSVWWLIVPALNLFMPDTVLNIWDPAITTPLSQMSPEDIFKNYGRSIGIGGIAMAGVIGIVKSWGVIRSAFSLVGQIFKSSAAAEETQRTQRDLSMKIIAIGSLVTILATALFFYFDVMGGNLLFTIVGILIVALIAFLFTTVAANAIAIVGSNPVSGMTLMTLILSSIIMVLVGLNGTGGMVAALIMGGVVCTALSSAGAFITDLKIGYWLGSTPKYQETYKFLGILISAATVGGVIMILNKAYGFTPDNSDVMAAPQARAMAAVIEPLMSGQGAPWLLYGIGALIALLLNACGISALAFALGMFIPLQLNLPLIVGGAVNWYVTTRSTSTEVNNLRGERGTLLASGFIAGGALMGVVSAAMQFGGISFANAEWLASSPAEWLSLGMYLLLIAYLMKASLSASR